MSAGTPFGALRTYAQMEPDDDFGFESFANAVRAGRTFMTSGPMIWLSVDAEKPGSVVSLPASGGTVEVEARAAAGFDVGRIELVVNGGVVASAESGGQNEVSLRESVSVDRTSWIAARCATPYFMRSAFPTWVGAHSSAVYIQCAERIQVDRAAAETLLALIAGCREWVETLAVVRSSAERARFSAFFAQAEAELRARLAAAS
jgi:hypothetical protein